MCGKCSSWCKVTIYQKLQLFMCVVVSVAGGATHSYFCEPPQKTRGWKNTSLVVHCRYFLNISYTILKSICINVQIWYKWRNLHQAKMTWLNFKRHVILIHTNQIRFLSKMNIHQLGFNYKPLKWVSVVSLWLTIAEYSPDNAGGGTKPVVQAPAHSLILSFNDLLMHTSFKQQNKPWLWHKFARTRLFLNLNPCVFFYQEQITDSVQQQHFHNQPKLRHKPMWRRQIFQIKLT